MADEGGLAIPGKLGWADGASYRHHFHFSSGTSELGRGGRMDYGPRSRRGLGTAISSVAPALPSDSRHFGAVFPALAHEAVAKCPHHGLGAILNAQLLQDAVYVGFDRSFGKNQRGHNLTVALAIAHALQDFPFPFG